MLPVTDQLLAAETWARCADILRFVLYVTPEGVRITPWSSGSPQPMSSIDMSERIHWFAIDPLAGTAADYATWGLGGMHRRPSARQLADPDEARWLCDCPMLEGRCDFDCWTMTHGLRLGEALDRDVAEFWAMLEASVARSE